MTLITAPSISQGSCSRFSLIDNTSSLITSIADSVFQGITLNCIFRRYSKVSSWVEKLTPSDSWILKIRISNPRFAAIFGSNWRREPAAAFLGFAKSGFPSSSWIALSFSKLFLGIYTSPRTINLGGALGIVIGIENIVFRFSVTSSPTTPSPRVAPRINLPFSYSRATERPSIFGSTVNDVPG